MGRYRVFIKTSAAKEIEAVDQKKDRQRIVAKIQSLTENPRPPGCEKLSGHEDKYRVREGPYRIVYSIEDKKLEVRVVKVGHRKEVYR
ncbi:MAG: type II toxin-antitoxin system RelE/ParE family toxin [Candidatus Rokubacteria bacterium]|nr:type II toxin-antitoxin system RelE/ParE family toxin [Candidatus Rokubacteria bacterium]